MNCKKMIAMLVLSIMAIGVVAQTAEAACVLDAMGLSGGNREFYGRRNGQGIYYWSFTHGHDFNDRGVGYNVTAYAKMSDKANYKAVNGVGEATAESAWQTNKTNADHKFTSGSGFTQVWTRN